MASLTFMTYQKLAVLYQLHCASARGAFCKAKVMNMASDINVITKTLCISNYAYAMKSPNKLYRNSKKAFYSLSKKVQKISDKVQKELVDKYQ